VFLLSDFLCGGWKKAITLCAGRHDLIAVRLLTPELEAPATGMVRVRAPESGVETVVDFGSPRVRAAYAERIADWHKETAEFLRRSEIDLMDVQVPREFDRDAVTRPILELFRMRERRGAKR
jgi:hypothetical protein